jgi:hypothetical protein
MSYLIADTGKRASPFPDPIDFCQDATYEGVPDKEQSFYLFRLRYSQ